MKLRRILEVLRFQGLQKKFWAQFHDLRVPNQSCLLRSADALWKYSACKVYRISSGSNFTIYTSKNEAVFREVETHFGSSPPARFAEKSSGRMFTICVSCKQTFLKSTFCKNALGTFYNFTLPYIFSVLLEHIVILLTFTLWICFESEHIWTANAPTNCDTRVWLYAKHFQTSLGLEPQSCFVISELRKSEQILWILT